MAVWCNYAMHLTGMSYLTFFYCLVLDFIYFPSQGQVTTTTTVTKKQLAEFTATYPKKRCLIHTRGISEGKVRIETADWRRDTVYVMVLSILVPWTPFAILYLSTPDTHSKQFFMSTEMIAGILAGLYIYDLPRFYIKRDGSEKLMPGWLSAMTAHHLITLLAIWYSASFQEWHATGTVLILGLVPKPIQFASQAFQKGALAKTLSRNNWIRLALTANFINLVCSFHVIQYTLYCVYALSAFTWWRNVLNISTFVLFTFIDLSMMDLKDVSAMRKMLSWEVAEEKYENVMEFAEDRERWIETYLKKQLEDDPETPFSPHVALKLFDVNSPQGDDVCHANFDTITDGGDVTSVKTSGAIASI